MFTTFNSLNLNKVFNSSAAASQKSQFIKNTQAPAVMFGSQRPDTFEVRFGTAVMPDEAVELSEADKRDLEALYAVSDPNDNDSDGRVRTVLSKHSSRKHPAALIDLQHLEPPEALEDLLKGLLKELDAAKDTWYEHTDRDKLISSKTLAKIPFVHIAFPKEDSDDHGLAWASFHTDGTKEITEHTPATFSLNYIGGDFKVLEYRIEEGLLGHEEIIEYTVFQEGNMPVKYQYVRTSDNAKEFDEAKFKIQTTVGQARQDYAEVDRERRESRANQIKIRASKGVPHEQIALFAEPDEDAHVNSEGQLALFKLPSDDDKK